MFLDFGGEKFIGKMFTKHQRAVVSTILEISPTALKAILFNENLSNFIINK